MQHEKLHHLQGLKSKLQAQIEEYNEEIEYLLNSTSVAEQELAERYIPLRAIKVVEYVGVKSAIKILIKAFTEADNRIKSAEMEADKMVGESASDINADDICRPQLSKKKLF